MVGIINSPHVEHLAVALAELGHEVHLIGEFSERLPVSEPVPGLRRTVFEIARSRIPGGESIQRVRLLRRALREWQPDVVHAHYMWWYGLFSALTGASPLVVSAWGTDVLRATPLQNALNRLVAHRADLVLADSEELLDRVRRLGVPRDRSALANWGVDLELFSPTGDRESERRHLGLPEGQIILSMRELFPTYSPRIILDAFGRVAAARPDAQLVMKHQQAVTPDLGPIPFADRVHFVGPRPYEDLVRYYRAADVCISIPISDSSPRSVWEAMAAGCACVLSDLPWVRELIVPDRHAVVTPIDAEAVAAAIGRILDDGGLAETLRREGRQLAEQERSQTTQMRRLVELYQRAVRNPR